MRLRSMACVTLIEALARRSVSRQLGERRTAASAKVHYRSCWTRGTLCRMVSRTGGKAGTAIGNQSGSTRAHQVPSAPRRRPAGLNACCAQPGLRCWERQERSGHRAVMCARQGFGTKTAALPCDDGLRRLPAPGASSAARYRGCREASKKTNTHIGRMPCWSRPIPWRLCDMGMGGGKRLKRATFSRCSIRPRSHPGGIPLRRWLDRRFDMAVVRGVNSDGF